MGVFQGKVRDPFLGFRFRVEIPGFGDVAGFQSCGGIGEESEVTEYREGNDPSTMRKLPGLTSFDNITLMKGVAKDEAFRLWRDNVMTRNPLSPLPDGLPQPNAAGNASSFRRTMIIKLFDKGDDVTGGRVTAVPAVVWVVLQAWPISLKVGDLDAESSDVLIETLEIANEGVYRSTPQSSVLI